jgi:hypothetical protein
MTATTDNKEETFESYIRSRCEIPHDIKRYIKQLHDKSEKELLNANDRLSNIIKGKNREIKKVRVALHQYIENYDEKIKQISELQTEILKLKEKNKV